MCESGVVLHCDVWPVVVCGWEVGLTIMLVGGGEATGEVLCIFFFSRHSSNMAEWFAASFFTHLQLKQLIGQLHEIMLCFPLQCIVQCVSMVCSSSPHRP